MNYLNFLISTPVLNWLIKKVFRSFVLKRIEARVSIERSKEYSTMKGMAGQPLAFDVLVRNESPAKLAISEISYRITRNGVPIQGVLWRHNHALATNGLELSVPDSMAAASPIRLTLLYNPLLAPPGEGDLRVEGSVAFESFFGGFTRSISRGLN